MVVTEVTERRGTSTAVQAASVGAGGGVEGKGGVELVVVVDGGA